MLSICNGVIFFFFYFAGSDANTDIGDYPSSFNIIPFKSHAFTVLVRLKTDCVFMRCDISRDNENDRIRGGGVCFNFFSSYNCSPHTAIVFQLNLYCLGKQFEFSSSRFTDELLINVHVQYVFVFEIHS